jgi:superoxide dismutase, Fe-Mn family
LAARNGWAVTAYDTFLRRYINFIIDGDDCNIPVGCYPVIVLDMWEHAFSRDYGAEKQQYVTSMMRELNWEVIERRVERAEQIGKVLKG